MDEIQHKKLVESVCKKLLENSILSESESDELRADLQNELMKIKNKEDLAKFMENNAGEIKSSFKKAEKESKPFYKKAWDWLCGAAKSTANFVGNNLGTILTAAGVLYAGHAIGFDRIKSFMGGLTTFFTGKDDKERKKAQGVMDDVTNSAINAIKTVADVKTQLTPKQQKKIWELRARLPDEPTVDKAMGFKSFFTAFINPDKALRMDAEKVRQKQMECSSVRFMEIVDKVIKNNPQKLDEFLEKVESAMDRSGIR